jgi:phosphoserine phosphatase RsbU/P
MLDALNDRLLERNNDGFVTGIALRIDANGRLMLANAGHLPPYLNGKELPLEGSLPLGIQPDLRYPAAVFDLDPGDGLTLLSDGVIEATNGARELFGFDRTCAISTQPAARIAEVARRFGQQDDITVLRIQYAPVAAFVA